MEWCNDGRINGQTDRLGWMDGFGWIFMDAFGWMDGWIDRLIG